MQKTFFLNRCQNRDSCEIFANNSIFGDPCRDSINVLEVIYNCYESIVNFLSIIRNFLLYNRCKQTNKKMVND